MVGDEQHLISWLFLSVRSSLANRSQSSSCHLNILSLMSIAASANALDHSDVVVVQWAKMLTRHIALILLAIKAVTSLSEVIPDEIELTEFRAKLHDNLRTIGFL